MQHDSSAWLEKVRFSIQQLLTAANLHQSILQRYCWCRIIFPVVNCLISPLLSYVNLFSAHWSLSVFPASPPPVSVQDCLPFQSWNPPRTKKKTKNPNPGLRALPEIVWLLSRTAAEETVKVVTELWIYDARECWNEPITCWICWSAFNSVGNDRDSVCWWAAEMPANGHVVI